MSIIPIFYPKLVNPNSRPCNFI